MVQHSKLLYKMASNIYEQNNQFIIRFPESVAEQIHSYLDSQSDSLSLQIGPDSPSKNISPRISLQVTVNHQSYKATVVQLPTISSTFKTIDRYNYFKSNDISQMIVVHEDQFDIINQSEAEAVEKVTDQGKIIEKYRGQSGLTEGTTNIRQNFHRKKPEIEKEKVRKVDIALGAIRAELIKEEGKSE